jgi:hypothetical protein
MAAAENFKIPLAKRGGMWYSDVILGVRRY